MRSYFRMTRHSESFEAYPKRITSVATFSFFMVGSDILGLVPLGGEVESFDRCASSCCCCMPKRRPNSATVGSSLRTGVVPVRPREGPFEPVYRASRWRPKEPVSSGAVRRLRDELQCYKSERNLI